MVLILLSSICGGLCIASLLCICCGNNDMVYNETEETDTINTNRIIIGPYNNHNVINIA